MTKRSKAARLNKEFVYDNDSDDDSDSFQGYMKKRAELSRKRSRTVAHEEYSSLLDNEAEKESSKVPGESKFIQGFLQSKKQRQLDELQTQALKIELHRKLEAGAQDAADSEEFITEGYKEQKEKLKQANIQRLEEEIKEREHSSRHFTAQLLGVAREIDKKVADGIISDEQMKPRAQVIVKNDVYVSNKNIWMKKGVLNSTGKVVSKRSDAMLKLVENFLKSSMKVEDIEKLRIKYQDRVKARQVNCS
ncbi:uncharacterized protein Ecym_5064 [Eremothecium cymbalariae DBVPG|uniref:Nuclear speckle splicing regulatory protein 1 N-terminal domain-containing protein n=1 Tax=Eremothecium cymbalariae (strain CBS 270.75 / DBVPG 7215 / KCTC 17166 / NRRL Y-17582) TaxID=931890 RepID=I6NCR2_ERECY|nr:hypothetical protein Ecym_5064 [Eremothecium cymbalariae DBVPG\